MAANKSGGIACAVEKIVAPVAAALGLSLWDVEFMKEGSTWYLRIYIDKEQGVSLEDCERFSREIDSPIDQADPIAQSYILEVSSPGVERELKKPLHFQRMEGKKIRVRLIRPDADGKREYIGILRGYTGGVIRLETGEDGNGIVKINKADTAFVKLYDEFIGGIE